MEAGLSLLVHQTLHGYAQGHELLASSVPLTPIERRTLDRLSDLSGYLPPGFSFERYFTGYPVGRFYALACTWPDTSGRRAGTVTTHTLLLSPEQAQPLVDPFSLAPHWRRPDLRSVEGYERPFETQALTSRPSPSRQIDRATRALWLTQGARPLLWVEPDPDRAREVIQALWRMAGPWRSSLAWCSLALDSRTTQDKPFDLLVLPPAARGAFHEHSRRPGWWWGDQLDAATEEASRRIEPLLQLSSLDFEARQAHAVDSCGQRGLPLPHPTALPRLLRLWELLQARDLRLPAARGVADLLALIWPELPGSHPEWVLTLKALLTQQREAPLAPNPFWELCDALRRPQLPAALAADPELGTVLNLSLQHEIGRRLLDGGEAALLALPELEGALKSVGQTEVLRSAAEAALAGARSPRKRELAKALVGAALRVGDEDRVGRLVDRLKKDERREWLPEIIQLQPHPSTARAQVREVASRLPDPWLLVALRAPGEEPTALLDQACSLLRASDPGWENRIHELARPFDTWEVVEWTLATADPTLALARCAGKRLAEDGAGPEEVLQRLASTSTSLPILGAWVQAARPPGVGAALLAHPELAVLVVARALRNPTDMGLNQLALALPLDERSPLLIREEVLSAVVAGPESQLGRQLIPLASGAVLGALVAGSTSPEWAASQLRHPPTLAWLKRGGAEEAARTLGRARVLGLPGLSTFCAGVLQQPGAWGAWVPEALVPHLQVCDGAELSKAAHDLGQLLQSREARADVRLGSEVVQAVRRTDCAAGATLLAATFAPMYIELQRGNTHPFFSSSWWFDVIWGWDKASGWREWLVDTWKSHQWPLTLLLDVLSADERLARKAIDYGGRRLAKDLRHAVTTSWTTSEANRREMLNVIDRFLD